MDKGWEVIGVGRRAEGPAGVRWIQADLETAAGIEAAAAGSERLGAVIHAAGDFVVATMEATTPAEFERIWRVTVWARHALTRALLPRLGAEAGAAARAVVHVASLAVHHDFAQETAYTSAMHAVVGLARAQDAELRGRGIRVSVLSPGLVRTPLTERHFGADVLAGALAPEAMAASAAHLIETVRTGGYIAEIFHVPQNSV